MEDVEMNNNNDDRLGLVMHTKLPSTVQKLYHHNVISVIIRLETLVNTWCVPNDLHPSIKI